MSCSLFELLTGLWLVESSTLPESVIAGMLGFPVPAAVAAVATPAASGVVVEKEHGQPSIDKTGVIRGTEQAAENSIHLAGAPPVSDRPPTKEGQG